MNGPNVATRPALAFHQLEKIAVFVFGVVFVVVLLTLVFVFERISPVAYTVVRIVLALAAAGIGAMIPGFLDIQAKGFVRAGGAMAMFVIVFFFTPPPPSAVVGTIDSPLPVTITDTVPADPAESPANIVQEWFALIDAEKYADAWNVSSRDSQNAYPKKMLIEVFEQQRKPLGTVVKRSFYGMQKMTAMQNGAKGNFRLLTYVTDFSSGKSMLEGVVLQVEDGRWKVLNHQIAFPPK